MTRDLKTILASQNTSLGTWSQIAAPEMIDMIGLNGFEFTIIDCEHGFFGLETAENLARAADANAIASALRVPRNDPVMIMKALDAGIRHVVVPGLENGPDAEAAVAATRFGPRGLRGACPCCRSGGHYIRDWPGYVAEEEARVGVIGLVETVEGARNIADIGKVDGLAGLMFGPFDLSVSLGLDGNWRDPRVMTMVEDMVAQAVDAGHPVIMPVFSTEPAECRDLIAHWKQRGVHTFVVGSDKIIVAHAFDGWNRALRAPI